jgi:ankyrin repeat protein
MTVFIKKETTWHEFTAERERFPTYQITDKGHLGLTALAASVFVNNMPLMEQIAKNGGAASINTPNLSGLTPLHSAISDNNYLFAKRLIELKANVNAASSCCSYDEQHIIPSGVTPLWIAAISVHSTALTKLLLINGAVPQEQFDAQGLQVLKEARDEIAQLTNTIRKTLSHQLPEVLIETIARYADDDAASPRSAWTCIIL